MEDCIETTTINGKETTTVFTKDGVFMSKRVVFIDRSIIIERWHNRDGLLHREGWPAIIDYEDGKITRQYWYKYDKKHREGRPAIIDYEDGKITSQYWYKKGKRHREGRPAIIHYEDDKITCQSWYKDGELHREVGPTHIRIKDGIIVNRWHKARNGISIHGEIDYLNVPEERRLSPTFRQVMRRLPLPIGDAIAWHFMEIWQFMDAD